MKFEEILSYLRHGIKVTRKNWHDKCFIYQPKPNDNLYKYFVVDQNDEDVELDFHSIFSDDWELYKEKLK